VQITPATDNEERVKRILAKLEARRARLAPPEPAVVVCPAGALPDEFAAEMFAAGRVAPVLCVPATPTTPDEVAAWERTGVAYQSWLLKRGHAIAEGTDTSQSLSPREAYRRALAGEPLPD
jgi:hypothetical protein